MGWEAWGGHLGDMSALRTQGSFSPQALHSHVQEASLLPSTRNYSGSLSKAPKAFQGPEVTLLTTSRTTASDRLCDLD